MKRLLPIVTLLLLATNAFAFVSELEIPTPDITLYATPASVTLGQSTTLTWTSMYATSCTASGGWSGAKARSDSKVVTPTVTTTYTLTCTGRGGATSVSVDVAVSKDLTPPPPPPSRTQCADAIDNDGDSKIDYPQDPGCANASDNDEADTVIQTPAPTCSVMASKNPVTVNETFSISWTSTNATYVADSGGKNNPSGSITLSVPTPGPYSYLITAVGAGGSTTCSTVVTVNPASPPTATTTPPVSSCPAYTVPTCALGSYITTGPTDTNGCSGVPRCTSGIAVGAPIYIASMLDTVGISHATSSGSPYGLSGTTGPNAIQMNVPVLNSAQIKYIYAPKLDTRKVWWLQSSVGLSPIVATATPPPPIIRKTPSQDGVLGASYGGSVRLIITANADKIDSSDPASEVLYSGTITPSTGVSAIKIPLGVWGMRPNLILTFIAQKVATDALQYGVTLDDLRLYSFGDRPDQGIVNNDPEWKSVDQQNKQLSALAQFPVTWVHDSIRHTGASWPQAPLLKREQDLGKKIQLVVGQTEEDYTDGTAALIPSACGFGVLPLSKLNLDLYEKRLKNNLTSYKNAGVDVKAVEVGNELDLYCFNADVPLTRTPTDADYALFANSYAKFLEKTATVVKRPEFYPNAKIILGSSALDFTVWSPATGSMDPGKMYAPLKNLNGKNYFNLVDGIAVHYYPRPGAEVESIKRTQSFLNTIGETNRPLWLSEWGFTNNTFPTSSGTDRYRAFVNLYDQILRANFKVVFMTNFALDEFSFPFHLVDKSYVKLPEARFFDHYPSPVPSIVALQKSEVENAVACVGCTALDWFDELVATVRDMILRLL